MAGKPWEKFQAQAPIQAAASGKPWEKFQAVTALPSEAPTPVSNPAPQEPVDDTQATAEAGLQGFGQGGTLGYLPQLQAGFGYAVEKANETLGGDKATPYADLREHFKRRNEKLKEDSPIATGVGNVAGAVMTLPVGGSAKGVGLGMKALRAAGVGAAYGAASNPEVESTPEDPHAELKARLQNAGYGTLLGGGAELGVAGAGKAITKAGEKMMGKAVVKQIGANAGQIKKILQKDELPKLGEFVAQEGLLAPGKSLEDVAEHTGQILTEDGPKIGALYDDAQKAIKEANGGNSVPMYKGPNGVWQPVGRVDGNALADQIVSKVKASSKNHPDRNAVAKAIDEAVAPLRDMGEDANLVDLHEFRKGLDENINWGARAKERDAIQRAYVDARNAVADATKNQIDSMDQALGGNQLDTLKKLNARYSTASTVNNISTQGVARETAKAFMGHGVIGAGAAALGGGAEYERSHDPVKAVGAGLATALGVTAARKFGAPVGYYGGKAAAGAGRALQAVTPRPGSVGAGATAPWLLMGDRYGQ